MKRYFLIDLENVGKSFLKGTEKLTIEDTIIVCHNRIRRGEINPDILNRLKESKARYSQIDICNDAKNAMDFCLCTQLGFLVAQNGANAKYYIVSNDKGFDVAKNFADAMFSGKSLIHRITSISATLEKEDNLAQEMQPVKELLTGYNKKVIKITQACLESTNTCFQFHNLLQKKLNEKDFHDVYERVKHLKPMQSA